MTDRSTIEIIGSLVVTLLGAALIGWAWRISHRKET